MATQRFNLQEKEAHIKRVLSYAPRMLGNMAVNFFLDRFRYANWVNYSAEPWVRRKVNKTARDKGRALLIKSGRGRRSIRITRIDGLAVHIGSDVPYMKAHNEGFKGTVNVKAYTRHSYSKHKVGTGKMNKSGSERMKTVSRISGSGQVRAHTMNMNIPRRKFMGYSPRLDKQLREKLQQELKFKN